jgi:hypothetical protein
MVIALLTTQSTTGFFILFLMGTYFLLFFVRDKTIAFTVLPIILVVGVIVYTNASFLKDKVEYQSEVSLNLDKGEFSNTRLGSFIFDLHYIKKHPIIGNGFNENTRYADDPELIQLIQMGTNLGNANGFSNHAACIGIPFMILYFMLAFKAVSKIDRRVGLLVMIVILLSLWGEQWLIYPLYTGIIFFKPLKITDKEYQVNKRKQRISINYLPHTENSSFGVSNT